MKKDLLIRCDDGSDLYQIVTMLAQLSSLVGGGRDVVSMLDVILMILEWSGDSIDFGQGLRDEISRLVARRRKLLADLPMDVREYAKAYAGTIVPHMKEENALTFNFLDTKSLYPCIAVVHIDNSQPIDKRITMAIQAGSQAKDMAGSGLKIQDGITELWTAMFQCMPVIFLKIMEIYHRSLDTYAPEISCITQHILDNDIRPEGWSEASYDHMFFKYMVSLRRDSLRYMQRHMLSDILDMIGKKLKDQDTVEDSDD